MCKKCKGLIKEIKVLSYLENFCGHGLIYLLDLYLDFRLLIFREKNILCLGDKFFSVKIEVKFYEIHHFLNNSNGGDWWTMRNKFV